MHVRRVTSAAIVESVDPERPFGPRRPEIADGSSRQPVAADPELWAFLKARSDVVPTLLPALAPSGSGYWYFQDSVFLVSGHEREEVVGAAIVGLVADEQRREREDEMIAEAREIEAERRRREEVAWARRVVDGADAGGATPRTGVPRSVRINVWERDAGRCAECGSTRFLQIDHVIPLAKGGSNEIGNLQLLCDDCNRRKSDRV